MDRSDHKSTTRSRKEKNQPKKVEHKWYHCYDEPNEISLTIDYDFIKDNVKQKMASCNAKDM